MNMQTTSAKQAELVFAAINRAWSEADNTDDRAELAFALIAAHAEVIRWNPTSVQGVTS